MYPQPRRKPLRMDAQHGPWSISVAESPYDPRTYSIYIQTPTHLLTLTRTASEIADLHAKVLDLNPPKLPALPLYEPAKRRSSFLHTLSRLANNAPKQPPSLPPATPSARSSIGYPTPAVSPNQERDDPFANPLSAPSAAATSLAAYLTDLSNRPNVRTARPWRRFVRVRTDDLESVRVERAIKRVRSDLTVHHPSPTTGAHGIVPLLHSVPVSDGDESVPDLDEHDSVSHAATATVVAAAPATKEEKVDVEEIDEGLISIREDAKIAEIIANATENDVFLAPAPTPAPVSVPEPLSPVTPPVERPLLQPVQPTRPDTTHEDPAVAILTEDAPPFLDDTPEPTLPTPAPSPPSPPSPPPHPAMRIPRSASADPDKAASRLSRTWQDPSSSMTTPVKGKLSLSSSSSSPTPKKSASKRKVVIDDFEMMRVLGKGCAGKVLLVRHRASDNLYALKAITKRHVLAHQELQHTLTEQAVLKRMAHEAKDPFVVKLWWSFHDKENLFLVMDFHPGGDLATQLARWGRLGRDRARFYAAEIVEGVEGLHAAGVIYRDLKPENILIGSDGHIVLTDFGLSKEFPRALNNSSSSSSSSSNAGHHHGAFYSSPGTPGPTLPHWMQDRHGSPSGGSSPGGSPGTNSGWIGVKDMTSTFCGTAEYLAPEVIQGSPYSYEVDWWSFGTMLYEMLTGITPFWANNHSDMYVRVLQDELQFPDDKAMDQDTKSLIRGLLQRNPALRMSEPRIKRHPYFSMIDWSHVYYKRYIPPYIPPIDPSNASDTQNFDETFLDMDPTIDNPDEADETEESRGVSPPRSGDGGAQQQEVDEDLFDGYSFKGRHSVIIDDEEFREEENVEGEADAEERQDVGVVVENGLPATPEEDVEEPPERLAGTEGIEQVIQQLDGILTPPTDQTLDVVPEMDDSSTPTQTSGTPTPQGPSVSAPASVSVLPETPLPDVPPPLPIKGALKSSSEPQHQQPPRTSTKVVTIVPPQVNTITTTRRREKSGVHALDRLRRQDIDADIERGSATERDDEDDEDEDDDWDLVETPGGEDRNGSKGTSLFARGVVDRYRLAVFSRKASNTHHNSATVANGSGTRVVSTSSSVAAGDDGSTSTASPESSKRGRLAKSTRSFLRARSPQPRSASSQQQLQSPSIAASLSSPAGSSTAASLAGTATSATMTTPMQTPHSLRSKESTTSMGGTPSASGSSDGGSVSRERLASAVEKRPLPEEQQHQQNQQQVEQGPRRLKKMKKYKEGAEKVLSLFGSPRQERAQAQQS